MSPRTLRRQLWGGMCALIVLIVPAVAASLVLMEWGANDLTSCTLPAALWCSLLAWLESQEKRDTRIGEHYGELSDFLGLNDII